MKYVMLFLFLLAALLGAQGDLEHSFLDLGLAMGSLISACLIYFKLDL